MPIHNFINETNNIYGRLTVLKRDATKSEKPYWICRCECGGKISVVAASLRAGRTKSCGCLRRELLSSSNHSNKAKDEIGKRYGKLVVTERVENIRRMVAWLCKCDCGKTRVVPGTYLRFSKVKGCLVCWPGRKIKPEGEAAFNVLYGQYKKRARKKKVAFALSRDEFKAITKQDCFYCGKKPGQRGATAGRYNGRYIYNGIDRKNNSKGYTLKNSVPCCGICNKMKRTQDCKEFISHISRIHTWVRCR